MNNAWGDFWLLPEYNFTPVVKSGD